MKQHHLNLPAASSHHNQGWQHCLQGAVQQQWSVDLLSVAHRSLGGCSVHCSQHGGK